MRALRWCLLLGLGGCDGGGEGVADPDALLEGDVEVIEMTEDLGLDAQAVDAVVPDSGAEEVDAATPDAAAEADGAADMQLPIDDFQPAALGMARALDEPCPRGAGAVPGTTCRQLEVRCPDLDPIRVELRITAAEPPLRGVVILQSGTAGSAFFSNGGEVTEGLIADLAARGFQVIERGWEQGGAGWFTGTEGPARSACRFATLVAWIAENLSEGAPLCAVANSGGTFEQALALTRYDTGDRLAAAVMTSGPMARLTEACPSEIDATWADRCHTAVGALFPECGGDRPERLQCAIGNGAQRLVDAAFGRDTPCSGAETPVDAGRLAPDDPIAPGSRLAFPFPVIFGFGELDCGGGTTPNGLQLADALAAAGTPTEVHALPGVPHQVHGVAAGTAFLLTALETHCR